MKGSVALRNCIGNPMYVNLANTNAKRNEWTDTLFITDYASSGINFMNSGASPIIVSDGMDQCIEITFDLVPDSGSFILDFGSLGQTGSLNYDNNESQMITEIMPLLGGAAMVEVFGTCATSIVIRLIGYSDDIALPTVDSNTLTSGGNPVTVTPVENNARLDYTFKYVVVSGAHGFIIPQELKSGKSLYILGAIADVTSGALIANFLG